MFKKPTLQETIEDIALHIQDKLAGGFATPRQALETALQMFGSKQDESVLRSNGEAALRSAVEERQRIESGWPAITDCDRFDAAFTKLESEGVVCRHNFSCCGTCAAGEIWGEINTERDKGRTIIGCAHYNCQDLDSAREGFGVCLSYGAVDEGEDASVGIGHKIANAMRDHGLTVEWNGNLDTRIHVALDWKRRMPSTTVV